MAEEGPAPVILRLYVAGGALRSRQAQQVTEQVVEQLGAERCHLEVVDVLADPGSAEADRVLATPMLLRVEPQPRIRLIGTLKDPAVVLAALQLPESVDA